MLYAAKLISFSVPHMVIFALDDGGIGDILWEYDPKDGPLLYRGRGSDDVDFAADFFHTSIMAGNAETEPRTCSRLFPDGIGTQLSAGSMVHRVTIK